MPRIKFEGLPHTDTYARIGVGEAWRAGEERSVSDSEAEYLLRTFPDAFSGSVAAPAQSSAMAPPAPRGGAAILAGSVGAVKEALASGGHDGDLADLLTAEEGGRARRGVIRALRSRMNEIA